MFFPFSILFIGLCPPTSQAFSFLPPQVTSSNQATQIRRFEILKIPHLNGSKQEIQEATKNDNHDDDSFSRETTNAEAPPKKNRTLSSICSIAVASSLFFGSMMNLHVDPAIAVDVDPYPTCTVACTSLSSSSIQLSKTITTMDMALPSSYDSISDATASGTAELTVETNVITNTSRKKVSTASTSSNSSKDRGRKALSDEEKAALAAEKQAERELLAAEEKAEKEALAAEKAAEREAIAAQKAAERELLAKEKAAENERRAEEKAQLLASQKAAKALAEEKKEKQASEAKFKGADFVDMALPSYDDNAAATGEKNSIFAL